MSTVILTTSMHAITGWIYHGQAGQGGQKTRIVNKMDELLNATEVKKILKCSLPYVYKLADQKRLPCVRIKGLSNEGKRSKDVVRFKQTDIREFVERYYQAPTT